MLFTRIFLQTAYQPFLVSKKPFKGHFNCQNFTHQLVGSFLYYYYSYYHYHQWHWFSFCSVRKFKGVCYKLQMLWWLLNKL